ncbi:MAG: helix-hairpin-helix domain-containing protein, partial [Candidatus Parcubacteria bacterium]|nr:helix-hairpin-helix domain-containing protein [Candidatus Parcubacteria bacterium]
MSNQEIAKIFYEIAIYFEMSDVPFKPQAYEKAALVLETLSEDVEKIYKKEGIEGLEKLPGVGKNIAEKIIEYLKTGKIKEYQNLKKKIPVNLEELTRVEGLGPKKIKILYQKLKIKNLKDLERAAKLHKISPLFGFGPKTEKNILEGIKFLKRNKGRFLLGEILPDVRIIYEKLKNLKEVKKISLAGSLRRMKETIGDVDILIVANKPGKVMDFFTSLPGVVKIWGKGTTKSSVRMKDGYDMDIRVVPEKSYGSALQYFTGSKEHNIATRKIAMDRGFKLNEYGVKTENDVYKMLGLPYIEPELRENQGEIEAAVNKKLPKLIGNKDICGDLHVHSSWDG